MVVLSTATALVLHAALAMADTETGDTGETGETAATEATSSESSTGDTDDDTTGGDTTHASATGSTGTTGSGVTGFTETDGRDPGYPTGGERDHLAFGGCRQHGATDWAWIALWIPLGGVFVRRRRA